MQLEARIDQNVSVAKELLAAKKRDRALVALKKKKLNENQVKTIQAWLLNVEDMVRGGKHSLRLSY
jgi:charged multivesicular body protein 6